MIHDYKLRPYHNPKGIDESKVPEGWRFRYADEMKTKNFEAKFWVLSAQSWELSLLCGVDPFATYIVPVAP